MGLWVIEMARQKKQTPPATPAPKDEALALIEEAKAARIEHSETACHGPTSVERRQSDNWWKET